MFFILSKVLYVLLYPISWILILWVWRWRSRTATTRKRLLISMIVLGIVFSNPFLYRSFVMSWQPVPKSLPDTAHYSAGIVLGGLSYYDKKDSGFFGPSADRFIQTANLYHRGIINKVLITGGTGNLMQREPPEAIFLKQEFIRNGVNEKDIILESRSRNTYENAIFSKRVLDSLKLQPPFVLVTSAMHMPRSVAVFKKAGINFISYPCDYTVIDERFDIDNYIIPDISLLKKWSWVIKEVVGFVAYRLTGKA